MEVTGQLHALDTLPLGETAPGIHWTPKLVWTLWRREKSSPFQESNPSHTAHSLLLYGLSYPFFLLLLLLLMWGVSKNCIHIFIKNIIQIFTEEPKFNVPLSSVACI
jgi:hypothetical protein